MVDARLDVIYAEVIDRQRMRVELNLPKHLEDLTRELFDCFVLGRSALKASIKEYFDRERAFIDRWWLWVDFAIRAFSKSGPFHRHFCSLPDPKAVSTCSHRRRFLEAASNFLRAMLDCIEPPTFWDTSAEELLKLLRDCAWLFAEYGVLEYGVPRGLPVAQALGCFCQEKKVFPEAWHFAIGQFFHAVDVWLLGDLLLRIKIDNKTLAGYIGEAIGDISDSGYMEETVRANHFVASVFHDIGRVSFYIPRIWGSVPVLAQVLIPEDEPSREALSERALALARGTNWGTDLEVVSNADHGVLSYYLLHKALSNILSDDEQMKFEGALEAVGYHDRFGSELAYISYPIATLFAVVDGLCIPDNDEDDPIARQAALSTGEEEYSLRNLLRFHSPIERIGFPSWAIGTQDRTNGTTDNLEIAVILRQETENRFCAPLNWMYACQDWARIDFGGFPVKLKVRFLSPYNSKQIAGREPPWMEGLRDYFSIRPRIAKVFWLDSSEAIEYQQKDISEELVVDLWKLSEDRTAASELDIDWKDFVAWSALRGKELA